MPSYQAKTYLDCLYGDVSLSSELLDLVSKPLVQRLRHVRLSNIDSLDMPGISNISRYEHALGTAHLCSRIGLRNTLARDERLILEAAALIHDTAIAPFGHLAEEALQYVNTGFSHEQQWGLLLAGNNDAQLGGVDLQLYLGHKSGLRQWLARTFGGDVESKLTELFDLINGKGKLSRLIAGDMDVDNIDNVTRIAYHMGLTVDRALPLRIVELVTGMTDSGEIRFSQAVVPFIVRWLELREEVYNRLMLAQSDFGGKLMLLYSTVRAFKSGRFTSSDWKLTDITYIETLLHLDDRAVVDTVQRWLLSDIWDLTPMLWVEGAAPSFSSMWQFSEYVSKKLDREYFAYRIKDKRKRKVRVCIQGAGPIELGADPSGWLLGGGSPVRRAFTVAELSRIPEFVGDFFGATISSTTRSAGARLF